MISVLADKQPVEFEPGPGGLTVIVHAQGMRVDWPDALEVTPRTTVKCMEEMSQPAWAHISGGPLFRELFGDLFPGLPIPEALADLLAGDHGVTHGAGLIVQVCEAAFAGAKKVFIRNPESGWHPATCQNFMTAMNKIMKLFGPGPVATEEAHA